MVCVQFSLMWFLLPVCSSLIALVCVTCVSLPHIFKPVSMLPHALWILCVPCVETVTCFLTTAASLIKELAL